MRKCLCGNIVVLVVLFAAWGGGAANAVGAKDTSGFAGVWTTVPGAQTPVVVSRRIKGMVALASDDLWAVGWSNVTRPNRALTAEPLIEHGDGTTWTALPTSMDRTARLYAVAAVSAIDIWAVGGIAPSVDTIDGGMIPFAMHYDGTTWTPMPLPAARASWGASPRVSLATVTATGPNDVWAAGRDGDTGIAYHWNGTTWASVGVPTASGVVRDALDWNGISAIASGDVWLVGERRVGQLGRSALQPVAAHWNGIGWTLVNTPLPAGTQNRLASVSGHAPDDVWVVGAVGTPPDWPTAAPDMRVMPFVVHWDGTQWSEVHVPLPDATATVTALDTVLAVSSDNVWVSGTYGLKVSLGDLVTDSARTFFLHWDGSVWNTVPAPPPPTGNGPPFDSPNALVATGPTDLWCGGQFANGSVSFLHYSGQGG